MGYGGSKVLNPKQNCFSSLMDATPDVRNSIKEFVASYNFSSEYVFLFTSSLGHRNV